MPGCMQDLQVAIAEVKNVAFLYQASRWSSFDAVFGIAQRAVRVCLEHGVRDVSGRQSILAGGVGENIGFSRVRQTLIELMMPSDMIEMRMACHGHQGTLGQPGKLLPQADDTRAAIDQNITVSSLNVSEVAAVKGPNVRFVDQTDPIGATLYLKPLISADNVHRCHSRGQDRLALERISAGPSRVADALSRAGP